MNEKKFSASSFSLSSSQLLPPALPALPGPPPGKGDGRNHADDRKDQQNHSKHRHDRDFGIHAVPGQNQCSQHFQIAGGHQHLLFIDMKKYEDQRQAEHDAHNSAVVHCNRDGCRKNAEEERERMILLDLLFKQHGKQKKSIIGDSRQIAVRKKHHGTESFTQDPENQCHHFIVQKWCRKIKKNGRNADHGSKTDIAHGESLLMNSMIPFLKLPHLTQQEVNAYISLSHSQITGNS